jgi:hypothetical protein
MALIMHTTIDGSTQSLALLRNWTALQIHQRTIYNDIEIQLYFTITTQVARSGLEPGTSISTVGIGLLLAGKAAMDYVPYNKFAYTVLRLNAALRFYID